jgi:hypothetical protein
MRGGKEDIAEISEHRGTAFIHFIDKTIGKLFSFGKAWQ